MSGYWSLSNRSSAGAAATASQASPAGSANGGQQVRLRALQVALAGTTAGNDQVVVRDGPSGTGTIIWTQDLSVVANGTASMDLADMDLRASIGNALTVEFVNGVTGDRESVNAQGDYVPIGYPLGMI